MKKLLIAIVLFGVLAVGADSPWSRFHYLRNLRWIGINGVVCPDYSCFERLTTSYLD